MYKLKTIARLLYEKIATDKNPNFNITNINLIKASKYFDPKWYTKKYPDTKKGGLDGAAHYLLHGAREGRDPGPKFSTRNYLLKNPDVAKSNVNPLIHFLYFGSKEGRHNIPLILNKDGSFCDTKIEDVLRNSEYFDHDWYIETYPDTAKNNTDPLSHYIRYGVHEGRDPGPNFSTTEYLTNNPDIATSGWNPLAHFVLFGASEGRKTFDSFWNPSGEISSQGVDTILRSSHYYDAEWYLQSYPDVARSGMDPLQHYIAYGAKEGRDPGPEFSTSFYMDQLGPADVMQNPLFHYECIGRHRNLLTSAKYLELSTCLPSGDIPQLSGGFDAGSMAIMLHMFYVDMADQFISRFERIPFAFDLLVSTDTEEKKENIISAFSGVQNLSKLDVRVTDNRGRDIAPFIVEFGRDLLKYDTAIHLHSKKSDYGSELYGWFDYCIDNLMNSPLYIEAIIRQFQQDAKLGIIYAMPFTPIVKHMHWAGCRPLAEQALKKMHIDAKILSKGTLNFPAGSMFWFKPKALSPLFNSRFSFADFPDETGQMNDTLAHAIERLFFYVAQSKGYSARAFRPANDGEFFLPRLVDPIINGSLEVPKSKEPDVSIVIPVYNQWSLTNACIRSIIEHTNFNETSYEIIIGDDGSTDETLNATKTYPGIKFIRTETNLGFLGNCNHAAKAAKGRYILFLNNDTQPQPNWLSALVNVADARSDVAIVGSKLIYPDGTLQEAGGIIWENAGGLNYGRDQDPSSAEYCYLRETDYVSGASLMVKSAFWTDIGGFDTRFIPAYYEDTDLCFQARDNGYKVLIQPESLVVHFEGISHGTDTGSGIKKHQVTNRKKFSAKWKDTLTTKHHDGSVLLRARERSMDKNIVVVIDFLLPEHDRHAGARHTFQYLKILVEKGYTVKYLAEKLTDIRQQRFARELQIMGVETYFPRTIDKSTDWNFWLTEHRDAIDLVILNRPNVAVKYLNNLTEMDIPTIYFCHDIHFLREQRQSKIKGNSSILRRTKMQQDSELSIFKNAGFSFTPSEFEVELLSEKHHIKNIAYLPVFLNTGSLVRKIHPPEGKNLLFVGGMKHAPNPDGVKWFIKEVFPLVLEKHPDAVFNIVGPDCPKDIRLLANSNIVIHGAVSADVLTRHYDNASAVVIPLRFGGGAKGKTVEAIQMGIPIISTDNGLEGIPIDKNILKPSSTSKAFAKAANKALSLDDDKWLEISHSLQAHADNYFSQDKGWEYLQRGLIATGISSAKRQG